MANGICSTPDPTVSALLETEAAYVHGVLITETMQLSQPGTYRVSWYLNDTLQRTSSMLIYTL